MQTRIMRKCHTAILTLPLLIAISCAPEYRPCWFGGDCGGSSGFVAGVFTLGDAFSEQVIQQRTFIEGTVVTTVTHRADDMDRQAILLDFNGDGKVDPVVGYHQEQIGIIQILLSYGDVGSVQYFPLTLDGGENQWDNFLDVAAGDIDGDGNLDLVAATRDGVVYLRHPTDPDHTHVLSEWGAETGELELIEGTSNWITADEINALIESAVGAGGNAEHYLATVEQGHTSTEIADLDNDGYNDIAASRQLSVYLTPKPDYDSLPTIQIVAGSIQVLINPHGARDGQGWTGYLVGYHERHEVLDREGARDLRAYDVDDDGDLDLISTAATDANVQVAWFENPGGPGPINPSADWPQHRIGSVRGAFTIDVADVTGDGRADVIATSPEQMQVVLFVQPASVADRGYDWYTAAIVNFESFEPRSVKAIDIDADGTLELVVGGTEGAVRYFDPPSIPTNIWEGRVILTFDPPGEVGLLGYGDLDADGDADIVGVVSSGEADANRVSWIRNDLY